jgi:LacI family transcriptional regulator
MPTVALPHIRDVASRAQVSVGTVSNVLNRPDKVSPATRSRVEEAIAHLGFVRNDSARQLKARRSRMIAYVVLDTTNPFFTDVARGIQDTAQGADLATFLCDTREDVARESNYLELLLEQRVHGVLVTPAGTDHTKLRSLVVMGVPVVLIDKTSDSRDWCTVSVNDIEGGEAAVTHLLELGHRRIAFVGGPSSMHQIQGRYKGALTAVERAGIPDATLSLLETAGLRVADGREAGQRLAGLPAAHRPTAAFCGNDLVALGLLQEMTRKGVAVPDDLSIVGYDDIDFAAAAAVPLTSVRQPRQLLGRVATELLLEEAAALSGPGGHEHRQIEFAPELVVRSSTGRAPGGPGPARRR